MDNKLSTSLQTTPPICHHSTAKQPASQGKSSPLLVLLEICLSIPHSESFTCNLLPFIVVFCGLNRYLNPLFTSSALLAHSCLRDVPTNDKGITPLISRLCQNNVTEWLVTRIIYFLVLLHFYGLLFRCGCPPNRNVHGS